MHCDVTFVSEILLGLHTSYLCWFILRIELEIAYQLSYAVSFHQQQKLVYFRTNTALHSSHLLLEKVGEYGNMLLTHS